MVWALIIVLTYSRHSFVWPTFSQKLVDVIEGLEAAFPNTWWSTTSPQQWRGVMAKRLVCAASGEPTPELRDMGGFALVGVGMRV